MTRWIKIARNQYWGFWIFGLILFALQEIPYMVMPLFERSSNPIMNMQESSMILDAAEKILGSLCIAVMTCIVQENASFFRIGSGVSKIGFIAATVVLLLNYFGWGLYFYGYQSFGIMMFFIVALPPAYYVCIGLWRGNWPLLAIGVLFEIVHFLHVFRNFTA